MVYVMCTCLSLAHVCPHVAGNVFKHFVCVKKMMLSDWDAFSEARARSLITPAEWGAFVNGMSVFTLSDCRCLRFYIFLFFVHLGTENVTKALSHTACLHLPLWITYAHWFNWLCIKNQMITWKMIFPLLPGGFSSKWQPLFNFRQRSKSLYYCAVAWGNQAMVDNTLTLEIGRWISQ